MLIGFSKYGTGNASGAIDYLLAERNAKGADRSPLPEIVSCEPAETRRLIDGISNKWKYTSGVLSFSEVITRDQEKEIIDRFERTAFAGLEPDQYNILWIRHTHTGRSELHFVSPRLELRTGKSLNIAPPQKQSDSRPLFDTLRSAINLTYGFSDPDDPERRQKVALPAYLKKIAKLHSDKSARLQDIREEISRYLSQSHVQSRADVIQKLQQAGFEITRTGKNYLGVRHDTIGRVRLRGSMFCEDGWKKAQPERSRLRLDALTRKLETMTAERARFNRNYYRPPENPTLSLDYVTLGTPAHRIPPTASSGIPEARSGTRAIARDLEARIGDYQNANRRFIQHAPGACSVIRKLAKTRRVLDAYSPFSSCSALREEEFIRERERNH